jgi:type II secretory pathway component GspD/PulD (secretin)/chromosome segregation ATPase
VSSKNRKSTAGPPAASIEVLGDLDQLILRGDPKAVERVEQALRQFEERAKAAKSSSVTDGGKGGASTTTQTKVTKIFSLRNAAALDTIQMLEKLFPKSGVSLAVDERTNSIVGEGDNETMSKIEAILLRLDEASSSRKASPKGQRGESRENTTAPQAASEKKSESPKSGPQQPAKPLHEELELTADGKIRFSFQNQPWPEVLQWLAKSSNLSLDWQEVPGAPLSLTTQRSYTLDEARNLLNMHLAARGFTLLRHSEVLTLARLDKLNPALVPRIEPDELASRDPHEFVRISFPLNGLVAENAVKEFAPVLSRYGKLTPMTATNRLEAMDSVANLLELARLLNREQSDAKTNQSKTSKMTKIFRLNETLATEVTPLLQRLFPDRGVSFGSDNSSNSIIASGDSETIRQIEELLLRLDRPASRSSDAQKQSAGGPADGQPTKPTGVFRSFELRYIPAQDAQRMLRQSLPNFTGRTAVDDRTNSILIGSDSETLNKVAEILQRLDQPSPARAPNPPSTGNAPRSRQQILREIEILQSKRSEKQKELDLHRPIPNAVATPESKRLAEELQQLQQQTIKLENELRSAPDTVATPNTPPAPSPAEQSNAQKFASLSRQVAQIDELIAKLETELDGKLKELSPLLLAANETDDSKRKKDSLRSDIKNLDLRITALEKDKEAPEKAMQQLWDDAAKQGGIPDHLLKAEIESNPRLMELRKKEVDLRYAKAVREVVTENSPTDHELLRLTRQLAEHQEAAKALYAELRESAMARLMYGHEGPDETIPVLEKRAERLGEMLRKDEALLKATHEQLAELSKGSAEVEALKAQIEDLHKSDEKLAKGLDAARADLGKNRENADLLEKTKILERQHSANEEQLRSMREQKLELSKKLGVGDDLNETRREQTRLLTEIQHIRNGIHTLSQRQLSAEEELEKLKAKAGALKEGKIPEALLRDEIHKHPRMIKLQERIAELEEEFKYTAGVAKDPRSNSAVAGKERQLAELKKEADQLYTDLRESAIAKLMFAGGLPGVTIPVLEKRIVRLNEMIQKEQAEVQATNEKLAALSKDSAEIEALKAQIEELTKINEEISKQLDKARLDLGMNPEKPDLLAKTQNLERQHSANQEQLRNLRAQKLDLSKKLGVGDDLNEVRREQARLLTQIQHVKNGIHTLEQRRTNAADELEVVKATAEALRQGKIPEALLRSEIDKNPRMIKLREQIAQLTEEHRRSAAAAKQPQPNPAVERYERRLRELNQKVEELRQQLRQETLRKRGYLPDSATSSKREEKSLAPDPFAPRAGTISDDPFAPRVDPLRPTTESRRRNEAAADHASGDKSNAAESSKEKAPVNAPEKSAPR